MKTANELRKYSVPLASAEKLEPGEYDGHTVKPGKPAAGVSFVSYWNMVTVARWLAKSCLEKA